LQRRPPGCQPGAGETDQEVGQDGGEFPEDEQQQQVVRHHQPEHGTGEGQELGTKAAEVLILFLEVPCAVHQHQRADAQHQEGHHPGKGIHPEGELKLEARDPRDHLGHCAVGRIDRSMLEQEPGKGCRGNSGQDVESVAAPSPEEERRQHSHRKVHGKDCNHWYLRNVRDSIVKSWSRRFIR
jgi:hypothetical protein